jgi:hypothetical protein
LREEVKKNITEISQLMFEAEISKSKQERLKIDEALKKLEKYYQKPKIGKNEKPQGGSKKKPEFIKDDKDKENIPIKDEKTEFIKNGKRPRPQKEDTPKPIFIPPAFPVNFFSNYFRGIH